MVLDFRLSCIGDVRSMLLLRKIPPPLYIVLMAMSIFQLTIMSFDDSTLATSREHPQ